MSIFDILHKKDKDEDGCFHQSHEDCETSNCERNPRRRKIDVCENGCMIHEYEQTIIDVARFVEAYRSRELRNQEMWMTIKQQVFGWGIIAVAGYIGSYVMEYAIKAVNAYFSVTLPLK